MRYSGWAWVEIIPAYDSEGALGCGCAVLLILAIPLFFAGLTLFACAMLFGVTVGFGDVDEDGRNAAFGLLLQWLGYASLWLVPLTLFGLHKARARSDRVISLAILGLLAALGLYATIGVAAQPYRKGLQVTYTVGRSVDAFDGEPSVTIGPIGAQDDGYYEVNFWCTGTTSDGLYVNTQVSARQPFGCDSRGSTTSTRHTVSLYFEKGPDNYINISADTWSLGSATIQKVIVHTAYIHPGSPSHQP